MDPEQMVAAVRSRDPEIFQELVGAYGDRLLRSACLLCGDFCEAQDLVQETFLQAFRSGDRFAGRSSVYTWLHGILLNLTRHHHRRSHRIVYDEELAGQEIIETVDFLSSLDVATTSDALLTALRQLSEPHREVLVLRYFENLRIHEMAAQLDVSPGPVKSRLHYAIAEMQKRLPGEMNLFGATGTNKKETV
jgi:RNA polymerase sigma-70 factor (ECF subfamily)